jgi:hypothetical protein
LVHHHIQQHADAARVRRIHQVAEIVLGAEVGVDGGEVRSPVAVEAVRRPVPSSVPSWICSTGGVIQIAFTPSESK